MGYREYTDDDVIRAAARVFSIAGLLRAINLKPTGGNYIHAKKTLQRLAIDTSHWTGQLWNKGERLKNWQDYTKVEKLKKHLLRERGIQCENCKLFTWLDKPITLEVEHLDGDRTNNHIDNLKLLCPNCHSYTRTWRRRKSSL
jgi:hypothetical protein